MICNYQRYIQEGGVTGSMPEARKAECLRLHAPHHAKCRPDAGGDPFAGVLTVVRDDRATGACRVCGAADCDKPECWRSILTAEENLAFKQRLTQHAAAAARDARTHQNGGGARR